MKTQDKTQSHLRNATPASPLRTARWAGIFMAIYCLLNFCLTQSTLAQMPEQSEEMRVLSYTESGDTGSVSTNRNYLWNFGYSRGSNSTGLYTVTYEDAWKQQYGEVQLIEYTIWLWDTNSNGLLLGTKYTTNIHADRYITNMSTGEVTFSPGYTNSSNYFNIGFPGVPSSTYPHGTLSNSVFQAINSPHTFDKMDYTVDLQFYAGYWTNDIPAGLFKFPITAIDGDTLLPIPDGEITFMEKNPDEDDHCVWKAIDDGDTKSANADIFVPPGQQQRNYVDSVTGIKYLVTIQPKFDGQMSPRDTNNIAWKGNGISPGVYDDGFAWAGDQLGMNLTRNNPDDGKLAWGFHKAQFTATFPATAKGGAIAWHRDSNSKRYLWSPGQGQPSQVATNQDLTFGSSNPNSNDDSGDSVPDSAGNIFDIDAASVGFTSNIANESFSSQDRPSGSRIALRFFAHQWVTFDNKVVCAVLRWRSFVTVKKEVNGISFPDDNVFGETPLGTDETPSYVVDPATGIPR